MPALDWMKWLEWLFYNTVIPLLVPVAIVKVFSWWLSRPPKQTLKIFAIIKDGQVFFYCTALTAVAFEDLKRVPSGFNTTPWVIGLLLILILSTAAFAVGVISKDSVDESKFGWSSVAMVAAAILVVITFREKAGLL
jgi:hypothetical protein